MKEVYITGGKRMLNIAFCDDDKVFLSQIKSETESILTSLRIKAKINAFSCGLDLIEKFNKYNPYYDIVFLDIDMPIFNGKDIAKELRILDKNFKLIFITSYEREALNTFQYDVAGFIPKILVGEKLRSVLERVTKLIEDENPQIQLIAVKRETDNPLTIKVPLNDIMYFESINRKIFMHTKREVFIMHNYIFSDIVEKYLKMEFVKIHRTCIINVKYIFSIDEIEIRLDNGEKLPISRRKKQEIFDKFVKTISEED